MRPHLALLLIGLAGCGPMRTSMISYDSLVDDREAAFFASRNAVALRTRDPMGGVLVVNDPYLDSAGRVVLTGGLASSGAAMIRVHCFDLSSFALERGWTTRLVWLDPDDRAVPVADVVTGPRAAEMLAECAAR